MDLKNSIINYIKDEKINSCIMIDGQWGSGKTYFIKKLIEELKDNRFEEIKVEDKYVHYISLNGLARVEEISKQLFIQSMGKIKELNDKFPKASSLTNMLFSTGLQFFGIEVNNPDYETFLSGESRIIFFDDLERCQIKIEEIFGYINDLAEHGNSKVIIVTNEEEMVLNEINLNKEEKIKIVLSQMIEFDEKSETKTITKNNIEKRIIDFFSDDIRYKKVKEKLVYRSFKYIPNLKNVYEYMVKKYTNDEFQEIILSEMNNVIGTLESKNHINIRTLQYILNSINSILNCVDYEFNNDEIKNYVFKKIINYISILSVNYKLSKPEPEWKERNRYGYVDTYNNLSFYNLGVLGFKFVDNYLYHSKLDRDYINSIIREYTEEVAIDEINQNYANQLKNFMSFTDQKLINSTEHCIEDIRLNKYSITTSLEVFFRVLQFNELGFDFDLDKLKGFILDNIDSYKNEIRIDFTYLAYKIPESNNAKDYIEEFNNKIKVHNENQDLFILDDVLNHSLTNNVDWNIRFKKVVEERRSIGSYGRSIFKHLNLDILADLIKSSSNEQIDDFRGTLLSIYRNIDLNQYYEGDRYALDNFKLIIEDYRKELENQKIRRYHIDLLISNLNSFVNGLKI